MSIFTKPPAVPSWFDFSRFGRWVLSGREERNWTQYELAAAAAKPKVKSPKRTIQNVEALARCGTRRGTKTTRGTWRPEADTILRIAEALDPRATTFDAIRSLYADDPPLFLERAPELDWAGITVPNCVLELDLTEIGGMDSTGFRIELDPDVTGARVPVHLLPMRRAWLAARKAAASRLRPLKNDPSYALVGVMQDRPRPDGRWRCTYVLRVRPCSYFDFLWPNTCLDERIDLADGRPPTTLRAEFGLRNPRLCDIDRIAGATLKLGAGVVMLTAAGTAVVSVRAADTAIAPGGYHLAVAEGMLSSDVSSPMCVSPFAVAIRGLRDELGLVSDVACRAKYDYREQDLRCLGLVLDTLRVQPMLFFRLETNLRFEDIYTSWKAARDRPENRNLIEIPWNRSNAERLIRGVISGRIPVGSLSPERVQLLAASNHVQAAFALAAKYDGF